MGDASCKTVCTCAAEFAGSETCSLTTEELAQKQALREQVVQGIHSILALEDPDQDTVVGWINFLKVASQAPDELSATAINSIMTALQTVQKSGVSSNLGVAALSGILATVNAAAQAVANTKLPGRRRLDDADSMALVLQTAAALDSYRAYASAQLLPGQDPVTAVYPQFRLHVENLAIDAGVGSDVSVKMPQSAFESSTGAAAPSAKFPVPPQSSRSALSVSVSSLSSQLFNGELGLSGYKRMYSNPLSLEFAGLPCSDAATCSYEVTLQTASMADALLERSPLEFFNTTCVTGDTATQTHTCSNGKVVSITCKGTAGTASIQCPIQYRSPVCRALDGLSVGDSGCTVKSQTDTSITCTCTVPADGRRVLSSAGGNSTVSATQAISYVGMLDEVEDNFVATIFSAQGLSLDSLKRGWSVLLTIGVFAGIVLFGLNWSYNADLEAAKVKPKYAEKAESILGTTEGRRQVWKKQISKKEVVGGELRIAEEALPMILGSGSLTSKITDELKHHHKWFGIIFYYSKSFPRVLRVVSLATNVLIMLFIQSLTYALTNPDDGTCESMTTEEDCLGPQSPYATGESKCYWDANKTEDQCMLVQPDSAMMVIVFVAIFSALISTPLAMLVDWIVLQVLASPLKTTAYVPSKRPLPPYIPPTGPSLTNVLVGGGSAKVAPTTLTRKRGGNFRLSSLFGFDNTSAIAAENNSKLHAQADLRVLVNKITAYRSNLTDKERAEFDGTTRSFCFLFSLILTFFLLFLNSGLGLGRDRPLQERRRKCQ
jgi:hypothetical protein